MDEENASFSCFAVDFSPKDYTITWSRNNKKVTEAPIGASSEGKRSANGTLYTAASFMQLEESKWKDENTIITCVFSNGKESVKASKTYSPEDCEYNFCNVE